MKKYYNHQKHCFLGSYKNTTFEQKLMEKNTQLKILLISHCDFIEKGIEKLGQ